MDIIERQGFTNLLNGPTNFITQPDHLLTSLSQTKHNLWKQQTF